MLDGAWIARQLINDLSWLIGCMTVATYLAGILRTIPRMYFYRQKPQYSHVTHMPNLRGITVVYFCYIGLLSAIVITCSTLVGHFRMRRQTTDVRQFEDTLMAVEYSTYSVSCLLVTIGYIVYGRKLTRIAYEGFELLQVFGGSPASRAQSAIEEKAGDVDSDLRSKKRKLRRTVWKVGADHALSVGFSSI
jgi:hypothetical protein